MTTPQDTKGDLKENITKLINFNPSMSQEEKDALISLLIDIYIPATILSAQREVKREVIHDIALMIQNTAKIRFGNRGKYIVDGFIEVAKKYGYLSSSEEE